MRDAAVEFPTVARRVIVEIGELLLVKAAVVSIAFFTRAVDEEKLFEIAFVLS